MKETTYFRLDESRPVMRLYMKGSTRRLSANKLMTELLEQECAENAQLRFNLQGRPYISFGKGDRYKTKGEMEARHGVPLKKMNNRLELTNSKFMLDILNEFELGRNITMADILLSLKSEENTDPDAVLDFAIERVAVIKEEGGSKKQETSQVDPVPETKAESEVTTETEKPTPAPELATVAVVDTREGGEDTSDIWMKVLYTDNGFVIRDDVGIMTSKECVGDELDEVLSKELGSEILGEIEHIDELKVNSFKNFLGWKVSVHIEPIEYGRQFFEN